MHNLKVGFAGLTHLGLNYLAASAEMGLNVVGLDFDRKKLNKLKDYVIEYKEPNLEKVIRKNKKKIFFTNNLINLKKCHLVFISQDVKTNNAGDSYYHSLKKLIQKTTKVLNKKAVLIILSQVQPGFTRNIKFDQKRLYYQVETLIFGQALKRALRPERVIVGCKNPQDKINSFFSRYLHKFSCPIVKMKYESAEFTKISINILLASSITASNMLAEACEKVSADWHEIMPALQLDRRIGSKAYIRPGLGISGGNIERDIASVKKILLKNKKALSVVKVFINNSIHMKSWVYRILKSEKILSNNNYNIGILGLAYKENTNSLKNSPAIHLLKKIKNNKINVYDPLIKLENKRKNCNYINNINSLIKISNVIIIMTPWNEYGNINKTLKKKKTKVLLIDPYRIVNFTSIKNRYIKYFTIGKKS